MQTKAWHKDKAEKLIKRYYPDSGDDREIAYLTTDERLLLALVHAVLSSAEGSYPS